MKARLCESCVISFFYIKPQRPTRNGYSKTVVLYLSSTSNHNNWIVILSHTCVVLYLSSTSNHNGTAAGKTKQMLCYIFLLHQTTTDTLSRLPHILLCYIFLLHQTTTNKTILLRQNGCVISFFYIKPQPHQVVQVSIRVVLYLSSTSNHNSQDAHWRKHMVVLYLSSTSNHNRSWRTMAADTLCYIFLLHQTTTARRGERALFGCVISFFYIKPQHPPIMEFRERRCVISFFYIKPQLDGQYYLRTRWLCYIFLLHQTTTYMR